MREPHSPIAPFELERYFAKHWSRQKACCSCQERFMLTRATIFAWGWAAKMHRRRWSGWQTSPGVTASLKKYLGNGLCSLGVQANP
jgi:hypothetical protein